MDPIILLLAAQLLVITAIVLTNLSPKASASSFSGKQLLQRLSTSIFFRQTEEPCELDEAEAVQSEPCPDALVIVPKSEASVSALSPVDVASGVRTKRKKKQNLKINEAKDRPSAKETAVETIESEEPGSSNFRLQCSLVWLITARLARAFSKLVVKMTFKGERSAGSALDQPRYCEASPRLAASRPVESNYLLKIIAARKAEKVVRFKVARLNMAIMKARGVRPMQVVPEAAEAEA